MMPFIRNAIYLYISIIHSLHMYLLSTVYQSWPVGKTPVRQVEELGKHGATASHTAWVRKGSQSDREAENQRKKRI